MYVVMTRVVKSKRGIYTWELCRLGLVVSVSASHAVDRGFTSRSGHTKDLHKWYTLPPCLTRMR